MLTSSSSVSASLLRRASDHRRKDVAWACPVQQQSLDRLMQYPCGFDCNEKGSLVADDAAPDVQHGTSFSAMIAARLSNDALTEDELVSMSYLMLIAGHETTVGLIGKRVASS